MRCRCASVRAPQPRCCRPTEAQPGQPGLCQKEPIFFRFFKNAQTCCSRQTARAAEFTCMQPQPLRPEGDKGLSSDHTSGRGGPERARRGGGWRNVRVRESAECPRRQSRRLAADVCTKLFQVSGVKRQMVEGKGKRRKNTALSIHRETQLATPRSAQPAVVGAKRHS